MIAEIGSNHNGSLEDAKRLISMAKFAGADAVKLQFFKANDLLPKTHPDFENVEKLETPLEWFETLQLYAYEQDIGIFASAFNKNFVKELVTRKIFAIKIASSEVTNLQLMSFYSKLQVPLVVSFGMSEWYEIEQAMSVLTKFGKRDIVTLHCVADYPLATENVNLANITSLGDRFGGIVGFSDHTMSVEMGAWAYSFGAKVLEKHITLDKNQSGPDHHYALEPEEFKKYVEGVAEFQQAIGNTRKTYSSSEIKGRGRFGCYARQDLEPGDTLEASVIEIRGPRLGIPSNLLPQFLGSKLRSSVSKGDYITFSDVES